MIRALVVGDLQRGITSQFPFSAGVVAPVERAVRHARFLDDVEVVLVRTALRANGADVRGNALFEGFHTLADVFQEPSAGTDIDPALGRHPADIQVTKRRTSAFAGTDLDLVLRAAGVGELVIVGVATSAMVAATVYDASDRDYRVTVLADGCADPDAAAHALFVGTVFPARQAQVLSVDDWISGTRT